jgi:hypothetical protein
MDELVLHTISFRLRYKLMLQGVYSLIYRHYSANFTVVIAI